MEFRVVIFMGGPGYEQLLFIIYSHIFVFRATLANKYEKYQNQRYKKSHSRGSYDVMQPLNADKGDANGVQSAASEKDCVKQPSLVRTLVATFWRLFLFGSFLKLVQDVLVFVNPQILKSVVY